MKSHRGFGIVGMLAVIVVVGAVIFAGVYLLHRPNPTTSGKIQNSENTQQTASADKISSGHSEAEIVKAPAETVKFSALPQDLQQVIKAKVAEITPPCIKDGQLVDYNGQPEDPDAIYAPVGSAVIGIGCDNDGKTASLFAKNKSGTWTYIARSQGYFDCDDIFHNPVPKKLMELATPAAECYDKTANTTLTYDEALSKRFY